MGASQGPGHMGLWEERPQGMGSLHPPGKMGCRTTGSLRHADFWGPSTEKGEGHTQQVTASKGDTWWGWRALSPASSFCLTSSMMNQVLLPCHFPWCPGSPVQGPWEMELGSDREVAAGQSWPVGPLATSIRRSMAGVGSQWGCGRRQRGCWHPHTLPWVPECALRHLCAAGVPRTF